MLLESKKKGNAVVDSIFIILVILILSAIFIIGKFAMSDLNDMAQDDDFLTNESKLVIQQQNESYAPLFDNMFLFILIALWAGALISAYLIDTHPIFFIITLLGLIIFLVTVPVLSNFMQEFFTDTDLAEFYVQFPIITYVIEHLLVIAIIMGFSIAIVLYAKGRSQ